MTIAVEESEDIDDVPVSTYRIKLGEPSKRELVTDIVDPFSISGDDLKKVVGLDAASKRRRSRQLEKVYTGHDGTESKRQDWQAETDAYNLFSVVLPKYNLDYLAQIYEMSDAHFAAVNVKASNIVGLGYDFVESPVTRRKLDKAKTSDKKDNIRNKLADLNQQLQDWLDDCNAEDTFTETLLKVWIDYESMGNGYVEISRTLDGTIGYIGHIPASTMRVRKDRDGFVQMVMNKVKFFRNFGDLDTPDQIGNDPQPNEIIHIKKYSPTSQFYGVPDIVAAQQAVVGNEFAARFNLDYFENKAVPRYVIVVKGGKFNTRGEQNLLEFFQTGLKGQNHRTIYVPLPADTNESKTSFDMKPVEAGQQDSSFANYHESNQDSILMVHRVPRTKVSMTGASLAAARDADKSFKEQVTRPQQDMFEKKLNRIFLQVSDGVFILKLKELSLTDEDVLSQMDERYLRWGVMTGNDIRVRRWGWDPLEWGDQQATMAGALTGAAAAKEAAKNTKIQADTQAKAAQANAVQNQAAAEQTAQAQQSRTRDANRSSASVDAKGEARNAAGAGRQQG
jgi:PBSX family phage portal protein